MNFGRDAFCLFKSRAPEFNVGNTSTAALVFTGRGSVASTENSSLK
jgi:hypothetical protein